MRVTLDSEQLALQPATVLPEELEAVNYTPEITFELDGEKRITLRRFLTEVSRELPEVYCDDESYERAEPKVIESGLLIPKGDPRRRANPFNLVVTDGEREERPVGYEFDLGLGVVFEPEIFDIVARSPRDIAKWAKSRTSAKASGQESDEAEKPKTTDELALATETEYQREIRSAVHALDGKLVGIDSLSKELREDRKLLASLYRALRPADRTHFKVKHLANHRRTLDERTHDTTDLAARNLDWGAFALQGVHGAIYNSLYNRPYAERLANAQSYIILLGKHCLAKYEKTMLSRHFNAKVRDEHMDMLPKHMQEVIREEYPLAYRDIPTPV